MNVKRENIGKHLLEYQLAMIEKDLMVMIDDDSWRFNNTLTRVQFEVFQQNSKKLIQKVFRCNLEKTLIIFNQFYEMFGLRIKG